MKFIGKVFESTKKALCEMLKPTKMLGVFSLLGSVTLSGVRYAGWACDQNLSWFR